MNKGLSIKDVRSQRGNLSCADILRTRGKRSSVTDIHTFWCKITSQFSKFMVCPHGQGRRGCASADIFRIRAERSIFCDFVRTSFMDGP